MSNTVVMAPSIDTVQHSEEEEDYLTCGRCLSEFPLQKINTFIKHKNQECDGPADSGLTQPTSLQCMSCPKAFVTAVGMLVHAQVTHNLKLFFDNGRHSSRFRNLFLPFDVQMGKSSPSESSATETFNSSSCFDPLCSNSGEIASSDKNQYVWANINRNAENCVPLTPRMVPEHCWNILQNFKNDVPELNNDNDGDGNKDAQGRVSFNEENDNSNFQTLENYLAHNSQNGDMTAAEETIRDAINLSKSYSSDNSSDEANDESNTLDDAGNELLNSDPNIELPVNLSLDKRSLGCDVPNKLMDTNEPSKETVSDGIYKHQPIHGQNCVISKRTSVIDKGTRVSTEKIAETDNLTTAEKETVEEGKSTCCKSQKCGVTIIPGTHENLKKCCNAVVPKKRKRHFETKHNVTRLRGDTIYIDLQSQRERYSTDKTRGITLSVSSRSRTPNSQMPMNVNSSERKEQLQNTIPLQIISSPVRKIGSSSFILHSGASLSLPPHSKNAMVVSTNSQTSNSISNNFQTTPENTTFGQSPRNSCESTVSTYSSTVHRNIQLHSNVRTYSANTNITSIGVNGNDNNIATGVIDEEGKRRRYPTCKPFKCELCDHAFNQRIHLKKHMSKHTGIKPYKCQQCDYSTVERSHLKVHIRIHTGEKPFKCLYCQYATAQRSTLKIHLKRHHRSKACP